MSIYIYIKNISAVLLVVLLSFLVISWDKSSTHNKGQVLNKSEINHHINALQAVIPISRKEQSLVYIQGLYSFQAIKYSSQDGPFLYVEKGYTPKRGNIEKRYYLKDRRLIFYTEVAEADHLNRGVRKSVYFQKSVQTGNNRSLFARLFFKDTIPASNGDVGYVARVKMLEDALNCEGKFDLRFSEVAQCSRVKYIILANNDMNGYRAPIKIHNDDEFSEELISNPEKYIGRKLDITWISANNVKEVLYNSGSLSRH